MKLTSITFPTCDKNSRGVTCQNWPQIGAFSESRGKPLVIGQRPLDLVIYSQPWSSLAGDEEFYMPKCSVYQIVKR